MIQTAEMTEFRIQNTEFRNVAEWGI